MPCRDDSSSYDYSAQERADKMTRIACKVMTELVDEGRAEFLLIRDDEIREWWSAHQEFDRQRRAEEYQRETEAALKKEALAKLSDQEKQALGLTHE